ncbi:MAG: bifunctional oligoribonuclease/PAP phosphatase NrnA [Trueperaceae bacterium]
MSSASPSGVTPSSGNQGDHGYPLVLAQIASLTREWQGPIVIAAHVDPDGDALGSSLALMRALRQLGKRAVVTMDPPRYLQFLAAEGDLVGELSQIEPETLVFALDAGDPERVWGVPLQQARAVINIDHHGTNTRFGDLAVVEPSKAACAILVKELIDLLGATWNSELATPCLTGIITDTGNFRHSNTGREAFEAAGALIEHGVDYPRLTDRLQWREKTYFPLLGRVMQTVRYDLNDLLVTAELTDAMRADLGAGDDDSDDFVGLIRYAEGTKVAALLKQRGEQVKVSVRTRDGVSAQRICVALGGGGHVSAAGATLPGPIDAARVRFTEAVRQELALFTADSGS